MRCPKCRSIELKQGTVKNSNGVVIDYCRVCKGIWLDQGELEKLSDAAIKDLSIPPELEKTRAICPRCDELMYAFDYPQTYVVVDMCKSCKGIWFDAGELKELQHVRNKLKSDRQFKEYDEVRGVKGSLVNFIEKAIEYLQSEMVWGEL